MTGFQLQESIRHIKCMTIWDFERVFGEDAKYLWDKLYSEFNRDVANWICYLDTNNIALLAGHLNKHLSKHDPSGGYWECKHCSMTIQKKYDRCLVCDSKRGQDQ